MTNDYNAQWGDSGSWPQEQNQNSWGASDNAWPADTQPTATIPAGNDLSHSRCDSKNRNFIVITITHLCCVHSCSWHDKIQSLV
jgi:hypothetical protein